MTSVTENRGYPYPECDPPEVKDSSDIRDLYDLAVAVNDDAAAQEAKLIDFVEKPDSARMSFAGNQTVPAAVGTDFLYIIPYNTVTYDNTTGMAVIAVQGMRVLERGFYLATSVARMTGAIGAALGVAHIVDGSLSGRRFEGPSGDISATGDCSMTTTDVLYLNVGDIVQTYVRTIAGPGTYPIEGRLSLHQILKLDVAP